MQLPTKSASLFIVACMIIAAQTGCYSTGAQPQQTFKAPFGSSGYLPYQSGYANQQPVFSQGPFQGNLNFGSNNAGSNTRFPATQTGWQNFQNNFNPFSFAKSTC